MAEPATTKQNYTKAKRGAVILTQHADRTMKSFLVLDGELKTLTTLNAWATLFFSLAGSTASLAFGLWSDMFIEGAPAENAKATVPVLEWLFVVLTVLFLGLAIWATCTKSSEVRRIKLESGDGD